jgi:hypothetical protein
MHYASKHVSNCASNYASNYVLIAVTGMIAVTCMVYLVRSSFSKHHQAFTQSQSPLSIHCHFEQAGLSVPLAVILHMPKG